jgi:hypothetical protein
MFLATSGPLLRFVKTAMPVLVCALFLPVTLQARYVDPKKKGKGLEDLQRVLVLDGSAIHNVGELQMHVTNWGEFGARPDTGLPYSYGPSAQWPAGTGVEYLFTAGLWVGALYQGVPAVSTAAFENEFRPTQDPRDIIYRTSEGARGGNRRPHPKADDDGDGAIDEDRLDGFDNDGDGRVDEDFAAISRLMFACQYTDYQSISRQIYTQHSPLDLVVRQESYQWSAARFDDFIGVEYQITNVGARVLEEVYIGLFVDGDAGPRERSNYWEDDLTGRLFIPVTCTDVGPVQFDFAYTYDADGDDGRTTGLFGVVALDHPIDLREGMTAPRSVGFRTYNYFSGHQSFEEGGDPTNDFERYELLSSGGSERDAELPRDYRMLVSIGPFAELLPDSTLVVQFAFANGDGEQAFANAASAKLASMGSWFDFDSRPGSGYSGRETPYYGHIFQVWADSCRIFKPPFEYGCDWERWDPIFNKPIPVVHEGEMAWSNADCEMECLFKNACGYPESDSLIFRTGVAGRETQVHWIMAAAPPPPKMRFDIHARDGVVIYWDSSSEEIADNITQVYDFEGYQIHRADGWTRPLGTSVVTGPPSDLWNALFQADIINAFGEDTGLQHLRYEPLTHILSEQQKRDFINALREFIVRNPDEDPPCPLGVTPAVCDTLIALARAEAGVAGGRHYYRYVDRSVHLGRPYFYSVVAFDHDVEGRQLIAGHAGVPSSNFSYVEPLSSSVEAYETTSRSIYVVPNPATRQSMEAWALDPTNDDPSGIKIEFRNLPKSTGTIRVYTLAGDLVKVLSFDGRGGVGTVKWDLVSRNGQDITSGVYLYSVDIDGGQFERVIDKFTVVR